MSGGSAYTTTPNLGLFKPMFNADVGTWGGHWNANADTLESAIGGLGTSYVPQTWGATTSTGYGTAIGQIPVFANRGGLPSFELGSQWIINQAAPSGVHGCDIFVRHDGTAVSDGTSSNVNGLMNLVQTVGANDKTLNFTLISQQTTHTTQAGAQGVGAFISCTRASDSNAHVWGALVAVN